MSFWLASWLWHQEKWCAFHNDSVLRCTWKLEGSKGRWNKALTEKKIKTGIFYDAHFFPFIIDDRVWGEKSGWSNWFLKEKTKDQMSLAVLAKGTQKPGRKNIQLHCCILLQHSLFLWHNKKSQTVIFR